MEEQRKKHIATLVGQYDYNLDSLIACIKQLETSLAEKDEQIDQLKAELIANVNSDDFICRRCGAVESRSVPEDRPREQELGPLDDMALGELEGLLDGFTLGESEQYGLTLGESDDREDEDFTEGASLGDVDGFTMGDTNANSNCPLGSGAAVQSESHEAHELITNVNNNDVILGRGPAVNERSGNIRFRQIVDDHKQQYSNATNERKKVIARSVLDAVKDSNPPGRFLIKHPGGFTICPDNRAREKASHALRDAAAKLRKQLKATEASA